MTLSCVVRLRKMLKNPLLDRLQFQIQILHEGTAAPTRKQVQQIISEKQRVQAEHVVVMSLKTQFGGNKSEALGFVYNSKDSMMKFEPKHRLIKQGLVEKPKIKTNRKTKKELKNKIKKLRGMEKVKARNFGKKK